MEPYLLLAVLVVVVAAYLGFATGDHRRRTAHGSGPRPQRSIGAALEAASERRGSALVVFLAEDEASAALASELAEDEALRARLAEPNLAYVVLRAEEKGQDVLEHLFEKYADAHLPQGPGAILFDADGAILGSGVIDGPLLGLISTWARATPRPRKEVEDPQGPAEEAEGK